MTVPWLIIVEEKSVPHNAKYNTVYFIMVLIKEYMHILILYNKIRIIYKKLSVFKLFIKWIQCIIRPIVKCWKKHKELILGETRQHEQMRECNQSNTESL